MYNIATVRWPCPATRFSTRLEENLTHSPQRSIGGAIIDRDDRDDPLWLWLLRSERDLDTDLVAGHQDRLRAALDRLEAYLDNPPKRPNLMDVMPRFWDALGGFAPGDLPRAQALYRRVVEVGGADTTYKHEALLELIAAAEAPASIPFWMELLDINRPRDTFAKQRRVMALSALAALAIRQNEPAARAQWIFFASGAVASASCLVR